MKLIQSQYRAYYKSQDEIIFALRVMEKLFTDWEYNLIEKALFQFMQNDSKGFPPVPGQIITLAAEIRRAEWEQKQREIQSLPEPEIKREPMPDEIRDKLKNLFKMPEGME
jgi:hypothetical protein